MIFITNEEKPGASYKELPPELYESILILYKTLGQDPQVLLNHGKALALLATTNPCHITTFALLGASLATFLLLEVELNDTTETESTDL